jgi:anaerobic carbon-monoxide dehydrogenase iron sulfur subunit
MRISVEREKCTGCHLCELACSLFHLGIINTEKSAIRIQKDDLDTSINTPVVCRQCKQMKCIDGEDVSATLVKKQFLWAKKRAERCPFDSLSVMGNDAFHCDLCAGHPQCVRVCTTNAIRVKK